MLPQSHIIIATHLHEAIKEKFLVDLDRKNLIYGSIKPDIPLHLSGIRHFKPQSFQYICDKIQNLSQYPLTNNKEHIKFLSTQIGIVTHFIADYFCVPHNDRKTYKNHFISHVAYESNLHQQYKKYNEKINIAKSLFNIDNKTPHSIKSLVDDLHNKYSNKSESYKNDLISSMEASMVVGLYIVYHNIMNNEYINAA
ncbi:zinc dependent phospholipase C family protein [Natronincola ferrireducens]|uniref:Zinc dependent phospholipase C n=1 Tax=Natronincola ferrireducens TaxID=393762 RepID=A0A1G9EN45_9FIRM|nr:zinc dependent phospholipase C family protein [Natronincola ferrireducens]SDK77425.1 Zinc dependent phospholipase C [Natronincola ferrireducens]